MLENMYDLFIDKYQDPLKSWDSMIEFLAVDNCASLVWKLNNKITWFYENSNFVERVMNIYDYNLLKSDYYDHLGDMYLEKILSRTGTGRRGSFLMPANEAESLARMTVQEADKPIKVLDPTVGTGRLLMAVHKRAPNSLAFGVDIDLRALRIAYTNFAIHNIEGYLLHADNRKHELDISTENGKNNWKFANNWYSRINELKQLSKSDNCKQPLEQNQKINENSLGHEKQS